MRHPVGYVITATCGGTERPSMRSCISFPRLGRCFNRRFSSRLGPRPRAQGHQSKQAARSVVLLPEFSKRIIGWSGRLRDLLGRRQGGQGLGGRGQGRSLFGACLSCSRELAGLLLSPFAGRRLGGGEPILPFSFLLLPWGSRFGFNARPLVLALVLGRRFARRGVCVLPLPPASSLRARGADVLRPRAASWPSLPSRGAGALSSSR